MFLRTLPFLVVFLAGSGLSKEILVLLPYPGYSHTMPFMPIFKKLGERGHHLTMVTPFPQEPTPKGFTQIKVNTSDPEIVEEMTKIFGTLIPRPGDGMLTFQILGFGFVCPHLGRYLLSRLKPVLPPTGKKYDLIFMEPFFCMEALLSASHIYKAPVVAVLPFPLIPTAAHAMGNPMDMAYIPNVRIPFGDKLTFFERSWNILINLIELLGNHFLWFPKQDELAREFLGYTGSPHITDFFQNISLLLTATHFSMNYPRPHMRNVLEVAGVTTITVKPLPKDLEKFINEAKDGIILFSWGSHYEPENADDILQSLMETFSKIKQRVLFKWSTADIANKPDNVLIQKWFPQPSILNHNNTVLFISHCGMNSIYEAAYFGVPVVGTPLFTDQPHNNVILENFGMALNIKISDLRAGSGALLKAINKIIGDPSFKENAMKRRQIVRDRPMPPLEEAVYWVEYLMRHGDSQLRPASRDLPWYSMALLDVAAFFIAVVALLILASYYLIRTCLSKCRRTKSSIRRAPKEKKNK